MSEQASVWVSPADRAREASCADKATEWLVQANELTDKRVIQSLRFDHWLFWTCKKDVHCSISQSTQTANHEIIRSSDAFCLMAPCYFSFKWSAYSIHAGLVEAAQNHCELSKRGKKPLHRQMPAAKPNLRLGSSFGRVWVRHSFSKPGVSLRSTAGWNCMIVWLCDWLSIRRSKECESNSVLSSIIPFF